MSERFVGKPIIRIDAAEKVTGTAVFGPDVMLSGMLYGKILRSPYAHAIIKSIDTSRVWELSGVRAVVSGDDLPGVLGGEAMKDLPFLAQGKVRYVGDPVVAVAAEDLETAEQSLKLIEVKYEEIPAVFDPREAMKESAPIIHENHHKYQHIPVMKPVPNSNILSFDEYRKGDTDRGFEEADYIFEDTFYSHTVQHAPIENHAVVARLTADGKYTIWVPNDGPHRLRKDLSDALKIPLTKIRVISTYIGGGFGSKGGLKLEPVAVALAQKTNHRPVKIVNTREEEFATCIVKHATFITVKTGVKKDGALAAREVTSIWDTGAYAEKGPTVCRQATAASAGPYRIPHVKLKGYCVYTNKVIAGAYRGYGITQVTWAYESAMDIIANKMGWDPLEFRLKNILREGDENPTGQTVHSIGVEDCLKKVAHAIGWENRKNAAQPAEVYKKRGYGISCAFKNTKTPSGSAAFLYLNQDSTANVVTSTVEVGQGAKTILAQIAAEVLGIPVDNVCVSNPDTDLSPFDASTTSSRATFHMGNAVKAAAEDIKEQLCSLAAEIIGCSRDDLTADGGEVKPKDQQVLNAAPISYKDILGKKYGAGGAILGRGFYYPDVVSTGMWSAPSIFWMYCAHAAEVEVDTETGKVRVLKLAAAQDVGKPINPVNCLQQVEGGAVMGMGAALWEKLIIDDKGRVLNPTLHDYKLPTAMDLPEVIPLIVDAPDQNGPFGAKGIGEIVVAPTMAALAAAIEDAVGVRIKEGPLSEEKVIEGLEQLKAAASEGF
jgi:CO/xanthine dehydrogenase Mo-binding subunit